mmetsp:Transcript_3296/g.5143  ORF Transcript_3296/g.5143 Transcript_3296/m.5143 type:complete len:843 (+) Transcript_3296:156-2684(+)|eukprot:CAMPEP_0185025886 /NCGR_PEP_ID=MMETSP1103-20130426/9434_1 /TAXON_ID=36769 /ORGANISM="Paraphysomonas bandaiensis, Strain Caron Lab Isolate" /LENGTH=842 /DNA_ID=CAMNT_0027559265 /DNA_START=137 /DNA_END=2665 /DNA_ORIENTATION=+
MSRSPQLERTVGLFWEKSGIDGNNPIALSHVLYDIAKSFSSAGNVDIAEIFMPSVTEEEERMFNEIGFEVIEETQENVINGRSLFCRILLWLWDTERTQKNTQLPCVVLVTRNNDYASMLNKFRNRSVYVVCISNFIEDNQPINHELRRACTTSIEFNDVIERSQEVSISEIKHCSDSDSPSPLNPPESSTGEPPHENSSSLRNDEENATNGKSPEESPQSVIHTRSGEDLFPDHTRGLPLSYQRSLWHVDNSAGYVPSAAVEDMQDMRLGGDPRLDAIHRSSSSEGSTSRYSSSGLPTHVSPSHFNSSSFNSSPFVPPKVNEVSPLADQGGFWNSTPPPSNQQSSGSEVISREQRALHGELVNAVYAYNVKTAVSTLRKIYTKQTRHYRIPTILAVVFPDTGAMVADGRTDLLNVAVGFSLDCIQWCFGMQKGENIESFKYKMNANIARWILRETVRKGVPSPPTQVIMNTTVSVVNHILDTVVELDFAWELLTAMKVPNAVQRLVPYILTWRASSDSSVEARVNEFLYDHQEFSIMIPPSQSRLDRNMFTPQGGYRWDDSADRKLVLGGGTHIMQAHPGQTKKHVDTEDQSLENRLLKLLARSQKGELGARIPALYRDEYGESLRLRGRKLKDILLDTGKVEMIGAEGPGDKVFRIVSKHGSNRPPMHRPSHTGETGMSSATGSYGGHHRSQSEDFLQLSIGNQQQQFPAADLRSRSEEYYNHQYHQNVFPQHCSGTRKVRPSGPPLTSILSYTSADSLHPPQQHQTSHQLQHSAASSYGYTDRSSSVESTSVPPYLHHQDDDDNSFLFSLHDSQQNYDYTAPMISELNRDSTVLHSEES